MDWEHFRRICEKSQPHSGAGARAVGHASRTAAPLAAEAVWLSHLWHYNVSPDYEASTRLFENLVNLARKKPEENIPATKNEAIPNHHLEPSLPSFLHIINWAEADLRLDGHERQHDLPSPSSHRHINA